MARAKNQPNGRFDKLDEAVRTLVRTQAAFVQNQAAFQAEMRELERQIAERFARIEAILLEHSRILGEHSRILAEHTHILAEHSRILQTLPDAIREKIGFKAPPRPDPSAPGLLPPGADATRLAKGRAAQARGHLASRPPPGGDALPRGSRFLVVRSRWLQKKQIFRH